MAMRREVADLSTRLSVSGLAEARASVKRFVAGIKSDTAGANLDAVSFTPRQMASAVLGLETIRKRFGVVTDAVKSVSSQTASATQAIGGLAAATAKIGIGALGNVARGAGTLAVGAGRRVATGAAVGAGAGIAGAIASVTSTSSDIKEQAKLASILGQSLEEFSGFAAVARQSGVAVDDLRGSMIQFAGQLADAANGGGTLKFFEDMGVAVKDASGKTRDLMDVFYDVSRAQSSLGKADRARTIALLFGEDDSAKVSELLNLMGQTTREAVSAQGALAKSKGFAYTEQDLALYKGMRTAVEGVKDAFRQLATYIFRATGPQIIDILRQVKVWIEANTASIAVLAYVFAAWMAGLASDITRFAFTGDNNFVNKWFMAFRDLQNISKGGVATFAPWLNIFYDLNQVMGGQPAIFNLWINTIVAYARAGYKEVVAVFNVVKLFMADIYRLVNNPGAVSSTNHFMIEWRDIAIQAFADVKKFAIQFSLDFIQAMQDLYVFLQPLFVLIIQSWQDFNKGFQTGDIKQVISLFGLLGVSVRFVADNLVAAAFGLAEFLRQLFQVIANGKQFEGSFAFLNPMLEKVKEGYKLFKQLYDTIDGVLKLFGFDLGKTLFFLGLLRLFGLLSIITGPAGVIAAFVSGLMGGGAAAAGAAVAGAFSTGGVVAALGVAGVALGKFLLIAGGVAIAVFAIVKAWEFLSEAFRNTPEPTMPKIPSAQAVQASARQPTGFGVNGASFSDRLNAETASLRQQISNGGGIGSDLLAGLNPAAASQPVNLYFQGEQQPVELFARQKSVLQELQSSDRFSTAAPAWAR